MEYFFLNIFYVFSAHVSWVVIDPMLAMGRARRGPQKPGPAHELVAWPTRPMGQSKNYLL